MARIVLTQEQAKVIEEGKDFVELRAPTGKYLGYVSHGVTEQDIAIALQRRASDHPRRTTEQVLDRLHSLKRP